MRATPQSPMERTRLRAAEAQASREAREQGATYAKPCDCDRPLWVEDEDSTVYCFHCTRRKA